jgi:hypothetical protein
MRLNGNFVALAKYRKYFDLNKENYTHSIVQYFAKATKLPFKRIKL